MSEPTIAQIHTACKNCAFAIYEKDTQIGCSTSFLEKYKNKGAEIIEVYDHDKEFYVINNKKCLSYRENVWFKQYNMEESSLSEKINKLHETNHLHYLLSVDLQNISKENLENIIYQIKELKVKPQKIIFIRHSHNANFDFSSLNSYLKNTGVGCSWRIQSMLEQLDHDTILHGIVNNNKSFRFILSIKDKTDNLSDLIEYADKKVYEELETVHVVTNKQRSAVLFSAPSYRFSYLVEGKDLLSANEDIEII